jgi:plasmid maintenance system antidote protein VapI
MKPRRWEMLNTVNPDYSVCPGVIIKEAMKLRKISTRKLAKLCNVRLCYIRKILKGKIELNYDIAIKICNCIEMSVAVLMHVDDNYKRSQKKIFCK